MSRQQQESTMGILTLWQKKPARFLTSSIGILIASLLVLFPSNAGNSWEMGEKVAVERGQNQMLTFTRADNDKIIPLRVGDRFALSLEENPTTGFQWAIESDGNEAVELQSDEFIRGEASGVGAGGRRVLTFTATREGTARLQLKLWRSWEGARSIGERFSLTLQIRE